MANKAKKRYRRGRVVGRSQVLNGRTRLWTKRNSKTGRFMDCKKDRKPFKSVRKER
jgi:hypothetical protein